MQTNNVILTALFTFCVGHVLGDATARDIDIAMKLGAGELVRTGWLCSSNVTLLIHTMTGIL